MNTGNTGSLVGVTRFILGSSVYIRLLCYVSCRTADTASRWRREQGLKSGWGGHGQLADDADLSIWCPVCRLLHSLSDDLSSMHVALSLSFTLYFLFHRDREGGSAPWVDYFTRRVLITWSDSIENSCLFHVTNLNKTTWKPFAYMD